MKLKKRLFIATVTGIILGSSLVGCNTTQEIVTEDVINKDVTQSEEQLEYSNLVDSKTQEEVKTSLIKAGIPAENAELFIKWVNEYNSNVESADSFKEGFTLYNGSEINYDDVYLRTDKETNKDTARMDTNCRLTAGLLMKDLVTVGQYNDEADNYLMFDVQAIQEDSKYDVLKADYQKYVTLFNPVTVEAGTDLTNHIAQIQTEWENRNIVFDEHANVSLITLFLHDPVENKRFVGHTGVLVEDEEGFVFVEKYASVLPYQVTKFNSEQEVVQYLLKRGDIMGDGSEGAPIVMRNATVIS